MERIPSAKASTHGVWEMEDQVSMQKGEVVVWPLAGVSLNLIYSAVELGLLLLKICEVGHGMIKSVFKKIRLVIALRLD